MHRLCAAGVVAGARGPRAVWPALALHNLGLLLAPVMMWVLWSQYRRHGQRSVVVLGMAGGALLVGHGVMHAVPETVLLAVFDWAGTALLIAATLVNLVVMRRWLVAQRDGFYAAVAAG